MLNPTTHTTEHDPERLVWGVQPGVACETIWSI